MAIDWDTYITPTSDEPITEEMLQHHIEVQARVNHVAELLREYRTDTFGAYRLDSTEVGDVVVYCNMSKYHHCCPTEYEQFDFPAKYLFMLDIEIRTIEGVAKSIRDEGAATKKKQEQEAVLAGKRRELARLMKELGE